MSGIRISIEVPIIKLNTTAPDLQKVLEEELLTTRNRLVMAVTQGHSDANGKSLRPYSSGYVDAIRKGKVFGYDGTKKSSTQTDLKITGLLMRSWQVKPIPGGAMTEFVGQRPSRSRAGYDGRDRNHHAGAKSTDRKTGGGKYGLGGRLASRLGTTDRKSGKSYSLSNSELAKLLYAQGFNGWVSFGQVDIDRIVARIKAELAKVAGKLIG